MNLVKVVNFDKVLERPVNSLQIYCSRPFELP